MIKAKGGFIKNVRCIFLIGIIFLGLMTIVGSNGGGDDGGDGGGEEEETTGKIDFKIYLYFSSITDVAEQYDYLTCPADSFFQGSSCIDLNIKVTLYGPEDNYNYSNFIAACDLGEYLDNMNSFTLLTCTCCLLSEFEPGIYTMKVEQKGDYGIKFWRQDVYLNFDNDAIETLYFDFIDFPASISFEILAGESTTVNLYIYEVEFDHAETIAGDVI